MQHKVLPDQAHCACSRALP